MLYLLDANVLITASNHYYPLDSVPEFWEWLLHMGEEGRVKIPLEIFEEIKGSARTATCQTYAGAWESGVATRLP